MAGQGAALDASPPATVLLALATELPGVEEACRVAGDALLEGQQSIPLVRYDAGWAVDTLMSWLISLLDRMGRGLHGHGEEAAGDDRDEQQVLGG